LESDGIGLNETFFLFTHLKKRKEEGQASLIHDYANLRLAVLELYLSIKIRPDEEISEFTKEMYQEEKDSMDGIDGYNIIDMIKSTIETLMNMRFETQDSCIDKDNIDIDNKFAE